MQLPKMKLYEKRNPQKTQKEAAFPPPEPV
jgi:hypothetical protein